MGPGSDSFAAGIHTLGTDKDVSISQHDTLTKRSVSFSAIFHLYSEPPALKRRDLKGAKEKLVLLFVPLLKVISLLAIGLLGFPKICNGNLARCQRQTSAWLLSVSHLFNAEVDGRFESGRPFNLTSYLEDKGAQILSMERSFSCLMSRY